MMEVSRAAEQELASERQEPWLPKADGWGICSLRCFPRVGTLRRRSRSALQQAEHFLWQFIPEVFPDCKEVCEAPPLRWSCIAPSEEVLDVL